MRQEYIEKMQQQGYALLFDLFDQWEQVKDELLLPDRKKGTGNGTVHIYLTKDNLLRNEFPTYYQAVGEGEDPAIQAVKITHFFDFANLSSGIAPMADYLFSHGVDSFIQVQDILLALAALPCKNGLMQTESLFKLTTDSRAYFKKFQSSGIFFKIVRCLLLPNSCYKISLFKSAEGEYAAMWELGLSQSNFSTTTIVPANQVNKSTPSPVPPLQQIFYGAPGTGKSHGIQEAEDDFAKVIRTTFHPDSDYSTFVGAYKPVKREQKIYSVNELAALWGSMYPTFPNRPEIRFASIYYKSLIAAGSAQYPNIFIGANTNVVNAEVPKGIAAAESYEKTVGGGEITYDFTPQAFTQAYVKAWKLYAENKGVLLVIEEINRGNCAQIFGDLFQLLDRRDDGFSSYPIVPDTDLQRFVAAQCISVNGVKDARGNDISTEICNGTNLLLPPNLYIWATMNTSDQSLFPIDSAFKRRWDWKYTKIKEGKDKAGQPLGWTMNFVDDPNNQGQKLGWWHFIKKLNKIIESMTDSADKELGYFFCKANDVKEITPEVFVGKVVFYLWNDVFKTCGFDDKHLFTYERDNNGTKETATLIFPGFYNDEGDVDTEVAKQFVLNVMNWKKN